MVSDDERCQALTKRRGTLRQCAQKYITLGTDGKRYCFYHNPRHPHKFGQGHNRPNRDLAAERRLDEACVKLKKAMAK